MIYVAKIFSGRLLPMKATNKVAVAALIMFALYAASFMPQGALASDAATYVIAN